MDLSNLHQWGLIWKMYTDDNDGYFVISFGMLHWASLLQPYFKDEGLLFCPEAKKPEIAGGRSPFAAWTDEDEDSGRIFTGSYGLNWWLTKDESANTTDAFGSTLRWKSPNVKGAGYVPMLVGCSLSGACVHHWDVPPQYDGQAWAAGEGGDIDEMRRFCMNRHDGYVSGVLLDYSARKIGLKELWVLKWSRHWFRTSDSNLTANYNPPVWPEWMINFRDY